MTRLGGSTLALVLLAAAGLAACDEPIRGPLARIAVKPSELVFYGATPRVQPYEKELRIENIGSSALRIASLTLVGDERFSMDDVGAPFVLSPREEIAMIVRYQSEDGLVRTGSILIESNDAVTPTLSVALRTEPVVPRIAVTDCVGAGEGPLPAVSPTLAGCDPRISDLLVDFGRVEVGQCRAARVHIDNTGEARLKVEAPVLTGEFQSSPAPAIRELEPISDDGVPDTFFIDVKFCPASVGTKTQQMLLRSNDPLAEEVLVTLSGMGGTTLAPRCTCPTAPIEVAPQDTVNLTASCTDPEGQPLEYRWTVVSRPGGSTEQIVNPSSRNATFTANTATTQTTPYVFRVTATDPTGGTDSCDTTVFAIPRDALHIQLVWDTPSTDIDLHFLNPQGVASPWSTTTGWFTTPNDNYFADVNPAWGAAGTTDDPRLDLDDMTGFGPENINLFRPASGRYRVGVHSYCNEATTRATVRIYCGGVIAREIGPRTLGRSEAFWEVAEITWPGCAITELNEPARTHESFCF